MMKSLAKTVAETCGTVRMVEHRCVHSGTDGITNPSVVRHGDAVLMSFRSPSYAFVTLRHNDRYGRNITYYPQNMPELPAVRHLSLNYICEFDSTRMEVSNPRPFLGGEDDKRDVGFRGKEDARLYSDGGSLFCSTSIFESWEKIDMCVNRLGDDYSVLEERHYNIRGVEKNWMPVIGRPGVFIHTVPGVVVDLNAVGGIAVRNNGMEMLYSGSTQLHPYRDGYVSVCHKRMKCESVKHFGWGYLHKFIYWTSGLEIAGESEWFSFMGFPIEFTCGILIDGDDVILPFSVFDTTSFVMKFDVSLLDSMLGFGEVRQNGGSRDACCDILRMNRHEDVCTAMCSYIIHATDNAAARICCMSYLASVCGETAARELYTGCLCELRRLDMRCDNGYPQVLVMQDFVTEQLCRLIH